MYRSMLKRDLKRKKTMNIILLLFIILAATFIASSMNNLLSITTAMKNYFAMAQLKDFMIVTMEEEENDKVIRSFLDKESNVKNWTVDQNLFITGQNIKLENGKNASLDNTAIVSSANISQQKFFDKDNKEIYIKDGEIYVPLKFMEDNSLKTGDSLEIVNETFKKSFTVTGNSKDAFLGSAMMGEARFLISDGDYKEMEEKSGFRKGEIYSVNTSDIKKLEDDFNQIGADIITSCDQALISLTYIMDMVIAGVLLIVSACLILISLVILRFTIVFTLNEEYREIGIMKAIGIRERKIRGLYIIKYLAISTAGAGIGFFCSIPFGNLFLRQVSKNIIISEQKGFWVNFLFSALIILIVVSFCYFCTRQVNRFSPIDAIRSGSNGERFKRKGILRLSKSRLSARSFLAWNDILSEPRKFGILVLIFTIGILLIIVPINTTNTLKSDRLVSWFGMVRSDVYLTNEYRQNKFMTQGGREAMVNYMDTLKENLKEKGIKADLFGETIFKFNISFDGRSYNSLALQGTGVSADQYTYTKGQPPAYENEVALTHVIAEKLDAGIGDTVTIKTGNTPKKYVVTAIYQSMNNMGEGIRFSEKETLDYGGAFGNFALQVKYLDHPSSREIKSRLELIKRLYPDFKVYTGGEYINHMLGNVAAQINGVQNIIIAVVLIINLLVAVLMEKTFLTKEKGEIGMLKSIGFRDSDIIIWQVLRIGIVLVISTVLAALLSGPAAQLSSGKIFEMMGTSHIDFEVKPLQVYVFYPLLLLAVTLAASVLTALPVRKISAQETNNIE